MLTVAIVYNEPVPSRYSGLGEDSAVAGVLQAVEAVDCALRELGHSPLRVPLRPPLDSLADSLKGIRADCLFNLFEGFPGTPETEAMVPQMAEELGLRYTGCPADALTLALDKAKTKAVLNAAGIKTPAYQLLEPGTVSAFHLEFPCIVKPRAEDASHGLSEASVVHDVPSLERQVATVCERYGAPALVEEFVDGREFNATVLGNEDPVVLPVSEIVYTLPAGAPRLLTYAAKWEPGSTYYENTTAVCPAPIPDADREHISALSVSAFKLLGCRGYARVDMRADAPGNVYVIEVNPNPDISPDVGAARQAAAAGMTYTRFIERILGLAQEKKP